MESDKQKLQITNSLKILTKLLKECESDYRIVGSLVIVAYKGKIFRRIGDVDIVLDSKSEKTVHDKLKKEGFVFVKKRWTSFVWWEASKKDHLGLTFFLVGDFTPNYFSYRFSRWGELRVNNDYLKPTPYSFDGISFIGIPISSAIAGIHQAFLNPKRTLDKHILAKEIKETEVKVFDNINVYLAGIKIPFLYDCFSFLYNVYGGLRVMFGKKYEMWD